MFTMRDPFVIYIICLSTATAALYTTYVAMVNNII